ncbi:MAG: hypothetical protein SLAVMIC_01008 [uncultured marine phage]|uniref:Uncharacterized protein n=1 Tax=uncultured marine phage TaxID=707152 RepID=A0A8D9CB10_9VIRU|nr:MAG: hypothetical protein SLAVMIC_01008 [uncultured marine phage]
MKKYNEFVNERKKWSPPTVGEQAKDIWWQQHYKELIKFVRENTDLVYNLVLAHSDEEESKAIMEGSGKQIAEILLQMMDIPDLEREIGLDTTIYIPPK